MLQSMDILYIISGLVLLFFGGEGLVRGAVGLAARMGISTLLVSLVIVGFGTSAPELLVCIKAALHGTPDMAVGNVVGSNIANIFLILGAAALFSPLASGQKSIRRDVVAVIVASALLCVLAYMGHVGRYTGGAMVLLLSGYLFYVYRQEKAAVPPEDEEQRVYKEQIDEDIGGRSYSALRAILFLVVGLAALVFGADLLVKGATDIARAFGVSEAVIGLSLIALGTSLPELATAVVASLRGHGDVILGNVLGSNLFNTLGILGVTAIISPLPVSERIADLDIWVMLGSAVVLLPVIITDHKISRKEGAVFLILYIGYVAAMYVL